MMIVLTPVLDAVDWLKTQDASVQVRAMAFVVALAALALNITLNFIPAVRKRRVENAKIGLHKVVRRKARAKLEEGDRKDMPRLSPPIRVFIWSSAQRHAIQEIQIEKGFGGISSAETDGWWHGSFVYDFWHEEPGHKR